MSRALEVFSSPWCITWLVVLLTESVAIVTLNVLTIIVFIKTRALRKRSMYLLINLAVADMLVGVFSLDFFVFLGVRCNLWKDIVPETWIYRVLVDTLNILFPLSSLTNIAVISLERLHATFWPFRHRVINKWVYGLIIAAIWVTGVLLSTALAVIWNLTEIWQFSIYIWMPFDSICLFVICISYASILIKVRYGAQPQHHGAASRERKLTMTLFIVTFLSLLLWLPWVITKLIYVTTDIFSSYAISEVAHLNYTMTVLFLANSLVNPILYTIRMPEYRRALVSLFSKRPRQQRQVEVIPLCVI